MSGIGFWELFLVFIIGLLILGPERLPRVASQIGRWVGRARRTANQLRYQLEREIALADIEKSTRNKKESTKPAAENKPAGEQETARPEADTEPSPEAARTGAETSAEPEPEAESETAEVSAAESKPAEASETERKQV